MDKQVSSLKKLYLVTYNSVLAVAWSIVLLKSVNYVSEKKTYVGLFDEVEMWLKMAQSAALLEVVHSIFGLVRSPVFSTVMQVASRVFVLWITLDVFVMRFPDAQATIGFPSLLFAWTVTEIVRYSFYVNSLLDTVPYWLLWCRYSFFIVLYPMGVMGEMVSIVASIPIAKRTEKFSLKLPNYLNVSFDFPFSCYVSLILYIPGLYFLYFYMFKQRAKVIGRKDKLS